MTKKKTKKFNLPKIYNVRNVLYQFKGDDLLNFDAVKFLTDIEVQEEFFFKEKLSVHEILAKVWQCKDTEKELIRKGIIEEKNPFYKRILKIIKLNPNLKNEIHEFCTMMYFENNSICPHWNFVKKIEKTKLDKIVFKALFDDNKCFPLFLNNLGKNELEKIRFISESDKKKPDLDLKTKTMMDVLCGYGAYRTKHKNLLKLINNNLNLPDDYDLLLNAIDKSTVYFYHLKKSELPELNTKVIEYNFNGVPITTEFENVAKFNDMEKSLTSCIHKQAAYGLDGKLYHSKNFEDLLYTFYEDDFLKKVIVNFLKEKADKAVKTENRAKWSYYAILLSSQKLSEELTDNLKSAQASTVKRMKI